MADNRTGLISRRRLLSSLGGGLALGGIPSTLRAAIDEELFMRIATGPTSGTYFPVGGVLTTAISNPPGSRECSRGGICGVPATIPNYPGG